MMQAAAGSFDVNLHNKYMKGMKQKWAQPCGASQDLTLRLTPPVMHASVLA
jgi:hypothetical protein